MNGIQIFNNEKFGKVRTIEVNGKTYFVATDVAKALKYVKPRNAIKQHCKGALKQGIVTSNRGVQEMSIIPKGDVFRLAAKSELPGAEEFESWIFDEVLPTIHETGAYITNKADPAELRKKANEIESIEALNKAVELMLPVFDEAGLKPQYKALALKQIYRKGGIELPIEELKAEKEIYDLGAIAAKVGIYSTTGRPHAQAVNAIISVLQISDDEKETTSFENHGHMGTTTQYTKSVIDKVKTWIINNKYPVDISGISKSYHVSYKGETAC